MKSKGKWHGTLYPAFEWHGVDLADAENQGQRTGTCPFCGKERHFFVEGSTGQWDCKVCGEAGNVVTFLSHLYKLHRKQTSLADWKRLAKDRGLPVSALQAWPLAWNGEYWLLGPRSEKGTFRDLRRWNYKVRRPMSTPGCTMQLFGVDQLTQYPKAEVYLCEGEWDAIALSWLLREAGIRPEDAVCVAVPGASTLKEAWVAALKDRTVHACYDADDAGDRGALKAYRELKGVAKAIDFLVWPESRPSGWDVRDQITKVYIPKKLPARRALRKLDKLFQPKPRWPDPHDAEPTTAKGEKGEEIELDEVGDFRKAPGPPITFQEIINLLSKQLVMTPQHIDMLKVILATAITIDIPTEPVWVNLVGGPGCGKTSLVSILRRHPRSVFRSSVTPAALVSGYAQAAKDPSLLPHLHQKLFIVKDASELITQHEQKVAETGSVLRGAYDGHHERSYGNAIHRNYQKLHFNALFCMTPAVHCRGSAELGERFLKLNLRVSPSTRSKMVLMAARRGFWGEEDLDEKICNAVNRFVYWHRIRSEEAAPKVPDDMLVKVSAMAEVLTILRGSVERQKFSSEREILYRPMEEVATRAVRTLVKAIQGCAAVEDRRKCGPEEFRMAQRLAMDSATGFNLDIIQGMMELGGAATRNEIAKTVALPEGTVRHRLEDLVVKDVIREVAEDAPAAKSKKARSAVVRARMSLLGRKGKLFRVRNWVRQRWETAGFTLLNEETAERRELELLQSED